MESYSTLTYALCPRRLRPMIARWRLMKRRAKQLHRSADNKDYVKLERD